MYHFPTEEYEMIARAVGNIVHEYMHNIKYNHTVHWTPTRKDSVPYAYGYIARDTALRFLGAGVDFPTLEEYMEGQEMLHGDEHLEQ